MKKTVLATIGVMILILVVAGFSYQIGIKGGLGLVFSGKTGKASTEILALVKSKVVQSQWASARGKITEIKDRTLTLTANEDNLTIPIKEEAELIGLIRGEGGAPVPEKIEFKDIKVGDEVMVQIEIIAGGQFVGGNVTVFPPPSE